ncbi:hypothetical protein [Luteococcus peritonei]|uniref:Uncharacterized protein n=1 Tax=Luteococcus peritonei TaxID=88874 RepID=A0ABW4RUE1_9ACTN
MDLIQTLATVGTLCVALWATWMARDQLAEAERQRKVQIGLQYLERYWDVSDSLLHSVKGSEEHRQHQHRYLILCEDEFEAAREEWLDDGMWERWHQWLVTESGREQTHADLAQCQRTNAFEFVRSCLGGAVGHSWQACPAHPDTQA